MPKLNQKESIIIKIYPPLELNQSSYFLAGLFELEKKGVIKCKVCLKNLNHPGRVSTINKIPEITNHFQEKNSFYELIHKDSRIKFAIDAYDFSYYFSIFAIKNCDFIFKRHFDKKYINSLDKNTQQKLAPLGLTFLVRSPNRHSSFSLFFGFLVFNMAKIRKFHLRKIYSIFKSSINHWNLYQKTRILTDFETNSSNSKLNILFQTRCFSDISDSDVKSIHSQRAELIRALKLQFPSNFIGGFIPDNISKTYFPDCITNSPTDSKGYLKLVQESSICIYTKGLANSPAWKLAEYLAQGKCIIAEKLTTILPEPLEHGKHIMYYNTIEECLEICEFLVKNPDKIKELSKNAQKYYLEFVSPAKSALRVINHLLNKNISIE